MIEREEGQVTILVIGFTILALAVSGIAIDGTRAFLARRTLQNAADAAALEAAGSLDEARFYSSGGTAAPIDTQLAGMRAARSLRQRGITAASSLRFQGTTAVLILRDRVPTLFLRLIGVGELPVAVEAAATGIEGQ